MHLLVAVVKYKTKLVKPRRGLCSNWLASLDTNSSKEVRIPMWLKQGTITFPKSLDVPVLMIGPGTVSFCFSFLNLFYYRVIKVVCGKTGLECADQIGLIIYCVVKYCSQVSQHWSSVGLSHIQLCLFNFVAPPTHTRGQLWVYKNKWNLSQTSLQISFQRNT